MQVLYKKCAGLDVHSAFVEACVRLQERRKLRYERGRFSATTAGLTALAEWLESHGVTHAVLEATGVYWKPVWHVLEGRVELMLANAQRVRNVPGRKSDVSDAQWLADLIAHGLVEASFVPPEAIRELRDLTRTRRQMIRRVVQDGNRLRKVLEDANIKLGNELADLLGLSGRRMLRAMADGERDAARLAALAHRRVKCPRERLIEALTGRLNGHHAFLIGMHLDAVEQTEGLIAALDARIDKVTAPVRDVIERLDEVPGLNRVGASFVIGEIGLDMSRFPSEGNLVSWARIVPRLDESAGRKRSTRVKKGGWLKPMLVQCARAAVKTKGSHAQAMYQRLKARRGDQKAIVAVARMILVTIYHMLKEGTFYQAPPPPELDTPTKARLATHLQARLESLGFEVTLTPAAPCASSAASATLPALVSG